MYRQYWNLNALPFLNVMDDRFVYMTEQHMEGLSRLIFLVSDGRMAGLLTGPLGVGKSLTLALLEHHAEKEKIPVVRMDAIPNGVLPMARYLLRSIGITDQPATFADALMLLQMHCKTVTNSPRWLLLIDEAHYLSSEKDGPYFAHYLCNLRVQTRSGQEEPLFTLVLVGTSELRDMVNNYESLRRRIQLDWVLEPLTESQTTEYIQHRIRNAGGDIWVFTPEALAEVYRWTQGVPRNINHLCDTALMLGFAAQASQVSREIVRQAAHDTALDVTELVSDTN